MPINRKCFFLKKFLNSHSGFDREELQNYLNLFAFIMNEGNQYERVEKILEWSLHYGIDETQYAYCSQFVLRYFATTFLESWHASQAAVLSKSFVKRLHSYAHGTAEYCTP